MSRFMAVLQGADEYRVWLKEEGDYQALKANARPSLERPAEGTCCPRCSEPLELEGYCGACDWGEGEVETW